MVKWEVRVGAHISLSFQTETNEMVRKGLFHQKTLSKQTENGHSFFMAFRVFPKGWLRSKQWKGGKG